MANPFYGKEPVKNQLRVKLEESLTDDERKGLALASAVNDKVHWALKMIDRVKTADVEAEQLKLKIGCLEIESGLAVHLAKVLIDGKPFPITGIRITGAVGEAWKIQVDFFPREGMTK